MPHGIILKRRTAHVTDGVLNLDGFTARDPEVLALVAGSDDAETAVRHALNIGARALSLAHAAEAGTGDSEH